MDIHPLIKGDNIYVSFSKKCVLNGLSFSINQGEHFALVGANGIGKSTLLRIMSGDLRLSQIVAAAHQEIPSNGSLHWCFTNEGPTPSALDAKKYIRLVSPAMQDQYLRHEWEITGQDIILSGFDNTPLLYTTPTKQQLHSVAQLAQRANMVELLGMSAAAMSQGQLRNTLLMRALISAPALILLDEPFDGLDDNARAILIRLMELSSINSSTFIITAHRAEDIPPFINTIYTLDGGKLLPVRALPHPATHQTIHLTDKADLVSFFKQRHSALPTMLQSAPVLKLEDVDVYIDRKHVLQSVNWTVDKGEHWIIQGHNGAGKSTLLRLLYGEECFAFGGQLSWFGTERMPLAELHRQVGYVSDRLHQNYTHEISAKDVIISGFAGTIGLYEEPQEIQQAVVHSWMDLLHITHLAEHPYQSLSTGESRRVLLARSLVGAPPVLLLDEPFSGLDPASREQFQSILPLLADSGIQILFVSHHSTDYSPIFTHELRLHVGRVTYSGKLRK